MAVCVGMAKAVYVKDAELELWQRAEAYAQERRLSMSALIMTALEQLLDEDQE
jgi:hypothetical protein